MRSTTSWFPEQAEYGFSHTLVREVAYARLPRMTRAGKHAAVGEWLEAAVGDRGEEFADALGAPFRAGGAAGRRLGRAGEGRRLAIRAPPPGCRPRARSRSASTRPARSRGTSGCWRSRPRTTRSTREALAYSALAGRRSALLGRDEVLRRQQRAVAIHVANGDKVAEARTRASLGGQLMAMARREDARREFATAAELLAGEPEAAAELALVHAWMAEDEMFAGQPRSRRRVRGPGARDRGGERAGRDHGPAHPGGLADRARRPRRDRRPARGARSRAGARLGLGDRHLLQLHRRSRVAGRRSGAGPAAAGRRAARWPTAAARSARGRGARSPRWSCCTSSAGGTRCSPAPCR